MKSVYGKIWFNSKREVDFCLYDSGNPLPVFNIRNDLNLPNIAHLYKETEQQLYEDLYNDNQED